jgi:hypothetical protein
MDRFTRFKILRALWARAKHLLAWLHGPRARDERLRAQRWHQINVAERQLRDGMIRGAGDPDSYLRPPGTDRPGPADAAWQAQWQWYAAHEQQERARQAQHQQHLNGRR